MSTTVTCPACRSTFTAGGPEGRPVICPRCRAQVSLTSAPFGEEAVTGQRPDAAAPPSGPTWPCPNCGGPIALSARKCRHCKRWVGEFDEPEVYRPRYKPCPRCGTSGAERVTFTFWGSFYGPSLFTHVRCPECGYGYNGKTGRSNLVPAVLFVTIPAVLILAIIGGLVLLIARSARW